MTKKLLLNLINGVLLVSFCNMGKAVGAVSSSHREERDLSISEKKVMKKGHSGDKAEEKRLESEPQKSKKSSRSRSMEPKRKVLQPSKQPPPPQEEVREVVPVVCNVHVLEVYRSPDCCSTDLWENMIKLQEKTLQSHNWKGSIGIKNLVYHWAKMYKTVDQNIKDVIALYFAVTSSSYARELAGGNDDDAEQEAIDFVRQCLVNEEGEPLFPQER